MWTVRGGLSRQRNCAEVWKEVWHGTTGEGKLSRPRTYGAWEVMWDGSKAGCRVWVQSMGAEFVCHPRGESIQLRPGAGLSTYLLVGFRQIVLYLRFLFSSKVGNLPTLKNCGMKQLFKKHCPLRACTFPLSSPQCGTHNLSVIKES